MKFSAAADIALQHFSSFFSIKWKFFAFLVLTNTRNATKKLCAVIDVLLLKLSVLNFMALKITAKTRVPDLQNDNKLEALASAKGE